MRNKLYIYVSIFLFFLCIRTMYATNYTTKQSGVFGNGSNWENGISPGHNSFNKYGGVNDTVFVKHTMTAASGFAVNGAQAIFIIQTGGSLNVTGSGYMNISNIIVEDGGNLSFTEGFSTSNQANNYITVGGGMHVGGDMSSFAGTWDVKENGRLQVDGSMINNDPSMTFTNNGNIHVGNNIQFHAGIWDMGPMSVFNTAGTDILVGDASVVNNGYMTFENATNVTTWSGSWDCDGSGSGTVAFAQNVNCSLACTGGGSSSCSANAPLPVEWVNVEVFPAFNGIKVIWSTSSEKNNDFFVVEKSWNGMDWFVAGSVNGSGNSSQIMDYEFVDKEETTKLCYYRLIQVDYSGHTEYSKTVYFQPEKKQMILRGLFPNPNDGTFYYMLQDEKLNSVEILSLQNEHIDHVLIIAEDGETLKIEIAGETEPGFYTAIISTDKTVHQKNFILK